MKKVLVVLFVVLLASPCLARSKKFQANIDVRHVQAQANLINARANQIRTQTQDRHMREMLEMVQRQHEQGLRNGARNRREKQGRKYKYIGW